VIMNHAFPMLQQEKKPETTPAPSGKKK